MSGILLSSVGNFKSSGVTINALNATLYSTTAQSLVSKWTIKSTNTIPGKNITYGNGYYYAVDYSSNFLRYSTDLITWSTRSVPSPSPATWDEVGFINGTFILTAINKISTSTDSITWTTPTTFGTNTSKQIINLNTIVILTDNSNIFYVSTNGTTWSTVTVGNSTYNISFTYDNSKYIFYDTTNGVIGTSTDAITWTTNTVSGLSGYSSDICYGNGKYIIQNNGSFRISTDLVTWTTSSGNANPNKVIFGNNQFVHWSTYWGGDVYSSTDAITWTASSFTTVASGNTDDPLVKYINNNFIALANSSVGSALRNISIGSSTPAYKYYVYNTPGTYSNDFSITGGTLLADILVVAGGGGGINYTAGTQTTYPGGAGAGGLLYLQNQSISGSNTITVGSGGILNTNGSNSQFGTLTAAVGGAKSTLGPGTTGGSGSGGGASNATAGSATSGQGFAGGTGRATTTRAGGGGGGAGSVGTNAASGVGGNGGSGVAYNDFGSATGLGELISGSYYFAGGGAGISTTSGVAGNGSAGPGGAGTSVTTAVNQAALVGQNGVVIIRTLA